VRANLQLHQANERTMLAWIRTGIALMAFGFAIARFGLFLRQLASMGTIDGRDTSIGSGWLGVVLVTLGVATNLVATIRYRAVRRAIDRDEDPVAGSGIVVGLGVLATAVGLLMWVLLVRSL
jgi:putative membrane protein